jgi:hypothetical protein
MTQLFGKLWMGKNACRCIWLQDLTGLEVGNAVSHASHGVARVSAAHVPERMNLPLLFVMAVSWSSLICRMYVLGQLWASHS